MEVDATQHRPLATNRFNRLWIKVSLMLIILILGAAGIIAWSLFESPVASPPKQDFVAGTGEKDDALGYTYQSNSWIRQYYTDNPRGYFQDGSPGDDSIYGWSVYASKEVALRADPSSKTLPLTINITEIAPMSPRWAAILTRKMLRIPSRKQAGLRFVITSNTKRSIDVIFCPPDDWNHPYQFVSLDLDTEPREHLIEVPESTVDRDVHIGLNLGGESGELKVHKLSLVGFRDEDPISHSKKHFIDYKMNKWGYRDDDWTINDPPGTVRIACLGDSFTFGQGVKVEDVFSEVIEDDLNSTSSSPPTKFETLNFGMSGYSQEEELELLRTVAVKFSPEIVVVTMCSNDPVSVRKEREINGIHDQQTNYRDYSLLLQKTIKELGFSGCIERLNQMNEYCKSHGMKMVVGIFNISDDKDWDRLVSEVVPAMKKEGIPVFDIAPELREANYFGAAGIVHDPTDMHPNEHAHAVYAKKLRSVIEKEVLPSLVK